MAEDPKTRRTLRAHAAVVRTLLEEAQRDHRAAEGWLDQATEESSRLLTAMAGHASQRPGAPEPEPPRTAHASHGCRILVVDDDPVVRDAMRRWLASRYDLVFAHDGEEGVELALTLSPDLILADVGLPGMNGIAMVHQIRERSRTASPPVLFLTGHDTPETLLAGFSAGGFAYLVKPVDLEWLDEEIRAALTA